MEKDGIHHGGNNSKYYMSEHLSNRRGHLWSWIRVVEIGLIALLGGLVWFRIAHMNQIYRILSQHHSL